MSNNDSQQTHRKPTPFKGGSFTNMDECEVCGRGAAELYVVDIEGASMHACRSCSGNKSLYKSSNVGVTPRFAKVNFRSSTEVIENYGKTIRQARESLGIPVKVLAERINEKESTLIRIERGDALPEDKLARKLEKFLNIKLFVAVSDDGVSHSAAKSKELTFGDSVRIRERKNNSD